MNSIDKKHIWAKFCNWVSNHHKLLIIIGSILVLLTASILVYLFVFNKSTTPSQSTPQAKVKEVELPKYYSPLTGVLVESDAATKQAVTGIMVENHPDARPQSGLKEAGVIFEAICEGGITRFLVLNQSEKPALIGPVRSVRMYYISWASAFDASIAHVGGNIDALAEMRNGTHRDLDEFSYANTYWRSDDRYAPHNMYTSSASLDTLNSQLGYTNSTFKGFSRIDGKPSDIPNATNVNITISDELFNSSYVYDATTNTYARFQAGEAHLDRELGQITPSVVIGMFVDEYTGPSAEGSEEYIDTINSGRAVIFQNGIATEATWQKTGPTSQIIFTDINGLDIPLIRGQTWIAAVPNGDGAVVWQ